MPFVVTNTGAKELDYEGASQEQDTVYSGTGGIPMGNFLQRALFAWRYKDINLLISSLIHPDSRIMIFRQIQDRVPKPAPFLKLDSDPYLAVVDGKLLWIYDAYTTTTEYPYSQEIDLGDATDGLITGGSANYMRNSVKVTVDAYTGAMTYYLVDPDDPIAVAWSKAFPEMFTPVTDASDELLSHFRYPENLFQVQASQFATYHVTDPAVFFQKQDVWQIPIDPTILANNPALEDTDEANRPMHPYYSLMRLPSAADEHFQLILPFTPEGRQNMVSWMAADSDPGSYGQLTAYTFPSGRNVDGPTQVFAQINQDPAFSTFRTLLGSTGLADRVRRLPGDPDQRLAPVRAAGVRPVEPGELDPGAQARGRRERQHGRRGDESVRSAHGLDHRSADRAGRGRRDTAAHGQPRRAGRRPVERRPAALHRRGRGVARG